MTMEGVDEHLGRYPTCSFTSGLQCVPRMSLSLGSLNATRLLVMEYLCHP